LPTTRELVFLLRSSLRFLLLLRVLFLVALLLLLMLMLMLPVHVVEVSDGLNNALLMRVPQ
jgi:hypothetical protein